MMNRLAQLFQDLGYTRENGLFYLSEADEWIQIFPYRIGHVLRDIIKPYAFFCLHREGSVHTDHPEPLNNPIILFFDNPSEEDFEKNIPKWTFSFGQAPVIIINRNETIDIYHGYDFDEQHPQWLRKIDRSVIAENDFSLGNLIVGKTWEKLYERYFKNTPTVDKYLLKNIIDARRLLIAGDVGGLSPKTANRLIGRLLFIRYLIDRKVSFKEGHISGETIQERRKNFLSLLQSKEKTYTFFTSITNKFNGDLFPLIEKDDKGEIIYDEKNEVNEHIHLKIMYELFDGSELFPMWGKDHGYTVQRSLFQMYDFAVIPVELISNIYENFLGELAHKHENRPRNLRDFPQAKQKQIKAYYTPPFLVDYILSQTVTPHLDHQQDSVSCKVLDPACGSGIFLVETLRKIIAKEMEIHPVIGSEGKPGIPNERLWELVHDNIFGIDIDSEAIEIAIFSLYITLLDYKTPIEIEEFNFEKLKGVNFFGGKEADFFNEDHPFNQKFKYEVELDFIISNTPWGDVKESRYHEYIKERNTREKQEDSESYVPLEIKKNEISQAFIIRASDFMLPNTRTKCVLIVSVKNLYNKGPSKVWRSYVLNKFCIEQVIDLSGVNTKITGGKKIFETAEQPPAIITYYPVQNGEIPAQNLVKHISIKPNRFFTTFRIIVIEKYDVKRVLQKYFMESEGGYDWLWKVLLHGNLLDFQFIRRLKEDYETFEELIKRYNLRHMRGLRPKFKNSGKNIDTTDYWDWDYLEIKTRKEFQPFCLMPTVTWKRKLEELIHEGTISEEGKIGRLPDIHFFKGKKLLVKRGGQAGHNFRFVAAFSEQDILFSDSVYSVKQAPETPYTPKIERLLKTLVGLINSKLCTYFLLCTSSSLGIDRTRSDIEEFSALPVVLENHIAEFTTKIQNRYQKLYAHSSSNLLDIYEKDRIDAAQQELERIIFESYQINEQEEALIDYAIHVAIPVVKREAGKKTRHSKIFQPLSVNKKPDSDYLMQYARVFVDHFGRRFNTDEEYFVGDIYVSHEFIGIHFRLTRKSDVQERISMKAAPDLMNLIANLGITQTTKDLYVQQDMRGFNKGSFYIIKPNERKCWHKAVAFADLSEFIHEFVKAEIRQRQKVS